MPVVRLRDELRARAVERPGADPLGRQPTAGQHVRGDGGEVRERGRVERARPEHPVVHGVVEHAAVCAHREPHRVQLREDPRDPARWPAGDEHEPDTGRHHPADHRGRTRGDALVGIEQRAVHVRGDQPGSPHPVQPTDVARQPVTPG